MRAREMNTKPPAAIMHAEEREINLFEQVIAAQTLAAQMVQCPNATARLSARATNSNNCII
jgi:hypothetical protein